MINVKLAVPGAQGISNLSMVNGQSSIPIGLWGQGVSITLK